MFALGSISEGQFHGVQSPLDVLCCPRRCSIHLQVPPDLCNISHSAEEGARAWDTLPRHARTRTLEICSRGTNDSLFFFPRFKLLPTEGSN